MTADIICGMKEEKENGFNAMLLFSAFLLR
jgi:hypothetical protein